MDISKLEDMRRELAVAKSSLIDVMNPLIDAIADLDFLIAEARLMRDELDRRETHDRDMDEERRAYWRAKEVQP